MPYTSFPGTYWGYPAAYVKKNCSLTPAPAPPPTPATPWVPTSVGACCNRACVGFTAGLNVTSACQVTTYENCLTLGTSWTFKGPDSTCEDGSCASSCCCDTSCTDGGAVTPFACSQQCHAGQWYGGDNYYSCTSNPAGSCLSCINQAPLTEPFVYKYVEPQPTPTGLCYYNGCIQFPTTINACRVTTHNDCYSSPGYTWVQGQSDCYSGYVRYFCQTSQSNPNANICGFYTWVAAQQLYTFGIGSDPTGILAYWYGDNYDPVCIPPASPPSLGCPTCAPFHPPPPPPPTPPPPTSITLPDFTATGSCCKVGCSDSGQTGQIGVACQTVPRTTCLELQRTTGEVYLYGGDGTSCGDGVSCVSSCCCAQPTPGDYSCSQLTAQQCQAACPVDGVFGGLTDQGAPKPCPADPNTCTVGVPSSCKPVAPPVHVGCCAKTWCDDSHTTDNAVPSITQAACAALPLGPAGQQRSWTAGGTSVGNCDNVVGACCCANKKCGASGFSADRCDAMCGAATGVGRWYGQGSWQDCGMTNPRSFNLGCPRCFDSADEYVTNCGPSWLDQLLNIGLDTLSCIAGIVGLDPSSCIASIAQYAEEFGPSQSFQPPPLCPQNYGFDP